MHAGLFSCTPFQHLLLGFVLLTAGCTIGSDVPLSDPDKATPNENLLGKWVSQSKDDPLTLTVRKAPPGYPPGVMLLSFTDDNPGNYTLFFTTELKGQTYANLCGGWACKPADLPPWDRARKRFGIVKYSVSGDSVIVWSPNEKLLQESITRRRLKGIIEQPRSGTYGGPFAVLQESTTDLVQFVLREDKALFPAQGTFKRVK